MKKLIAILLTLTMVVGLGASAFAAAPYTLTYDANGGTDPEAGTTGADGKIALATATHAADEDGNAIVLIGWTETKHTTIYAAGETTPTFWEAGTQITLTANKTLYALWGFDVNGTGDPDVVEEGDVYTITYDANGGEGAPAEQKVVGTTATLSTTEPTYEGYAFLGWVAGVEGAAAPVAIQKDAENPDLSAVKAPGAEVTLTGDTTYYAQWAVDENKNGEPDYSEERYTVEYDMGNTISKDGVVRTFETEMTAPAKEENLVEGTKHDLATPSVKTNTAKYDVEDKTANVAFLGWTKDEAVAFEIYDVGDTVAVVNSITVSEETAGKYYAVWGYDNDGNGIADIDDDAAAAAGNDTIIITMKPSPDLETQGEEKFTAYKIFDVTKIDGIEEPVTTDETLGAGGEDEGFAYSISAESPWLSVIQNELADYFILTPSADGTVYTVELVDPNPETADVNENNTEDVAKAIAAILKANIPDGVTGEEFDSGTKIYTAPGYYLITSSISDILILATTSIEIESKDEYIVDEKVVETASVTVGESATYYIKVELPASIDPTKPVTVHDNLDDVLKFNNDVQVSVGDTDPGDEVADYKELTYVTVPATAYPGISFTTTVDDDCDFEIVIANPLDDYAGKYLVFKYSAELTSDAVGEDGFVNEEYTSYSNYETTPSKPEVKTYEFEFTKVDGNDAKLDGAKFEFYAEIDGEMSEEPLQLVVKEDDTGTYYELADSDDTETVTVIEVNSKTSNGPTRIYGVGGKDNEEGTNFYLLETEAPEGFNKLDKPIIINVLDDGTITYSLDGETFESASEAFDVVNQSGTVLPSTGGIGTTIFYIVGGLLAVGAGVLLVTKKRMGKIED